MILIASLSISVQSFSSIYKNGDSQNTISNTSLNTTLDYALTDKSKLNKRKELATTAQAKNLYLVKKYLNTQHKYNYQLNHNKNQTYNKGKIDAR